MFLLLIRIALVVLVCLLCLKFDVATPLTLIIPSLFIVGLDLFNHVNQEQDETVGMVEEELQSVVTQEDSLPIDLETNEEETIRIVEDTNVADVESETKQEETTVVLPLNDSERINSPDSIEDHPNTKKEDLPVQVVEKIIVTPLNLGTSSNSDGAKELSSTVSKKVKSDIEQLEDEQLEKIEANAEHFEKVDILLKSDPNFIERAVNANSKLLHLLKEDELLIVLEKYEYLFVKLDDSYQNNLEFVQKVRERNRLIYFYITNDDTFALLLAEEIVSGTLSDLIIPPNRLKLALEKLTKNREFYNEHRRKILKLVADDPWEKRHIFPFIVDDFDVVLQAVSRNGLDLQYASERLRRDRDIITAALRNNRLARVFIPKDFYLKFGEPII